MSDTGELFSFIPTLQSVFNFRFTWKSWASGDVKGIMKMRIWRSRSHTDGAVTLGSVWVMVVNGVLCSHWGNELQLPQCDLKEYDRISHLDSHFTYLITCFGQLIPKCLLFLFTRCYSSTILGVIQRALLWTNSSSFITRIPFSCNWNKTLAP